MLSQVLYIKKQKLGRKIWIRPSSFALPHPLCYHIQWYEWMNEYRHEDGTVILKETCAKTSGFFLFMHPK